MRRKTRLYLLLLLVLVGLPVGLIGGAWWYVGSGQLRVRIESAWDLPGRLQVGSVRLVGPDSLLITDIAIHAADGQLLASCAEARVSDGLWRADPGLIAARDWMVLADATALVAWRNLLEAIRRRPVTDGAVMPRLDLQEGLLRLPGGSLPGLSIQHDVDSTSLQSADGLQVRGSATPTGRLWRWQAGSVPVMDLLLAVHQLGLLPDPDPHLLLFVPVQVDGTGSELQWQGPERWRLDLQATWAGSGACVLQAERTQGRLSLEPRTLAHGHLPGLRMQDGDLFLRHRDTEALVLSDPVLRLQGLPAMRTAVLEAAVGGRALPLRAEWARHDDRLVVQLPQAGVDAADLSTWIGLWTSPPAWLTLPPVLHLDGSRYEIQEQGASASIALHWAGGDALVQGRERTSGAWRWRLASASGSDLPDGVHVQDGRWHLGHDLVLPSVLVDWHADAVRAQIGLAADRALQLERQGDAVVITDGSLPLDRLLRWVADWGWLPLPPAALLEWTGTGLDPVGSRLDWSAGLQVAARARGQDWSLEALARPQGQAGGWSLDDLSVQHRHLGRLDGALELTAAGQQLSWDELGFGPGLARLVDLPLDWPAVGRAVAAGGLSHADGAITVQATTTAGGQLQLHSAAGNGRCGHCCATRSPPCRRVWPAASCPRRCRWWTGVSTASPCSGMMPCSWTGPGRLLICASAACRCRAWTAASPCARPMGCISSWSCPEGPGSPGRNRLRRPAVWTCRVGIWRRSASICRPTGRRCPAGSTCALRCCPIRRDCAGVSRSCA
ncbi:MAG: hypothetical protein ACOCXJ_03040 [Planctomycetota bacterium]